MIRVLWPQLAADQEMKARCLREAQLAARLRHPRIAEVLDIDVEADGAVERVVRFAVADPDTLLVSLGF